MGSTTIILGLFLGLLAGYSTTRPAPQPHPEPPTPDPNLKLAQALADYLNKLQDSESKP